MNEDQIYAVICDWFTDNRGHGYVAIGTDHINDETGLPYPTTCATLDGEFDLLALTKHIMICSLSSQND